MIEPKIDEASAREFKLFLRDVLLQASTLIAGKIPGLTPTDAATLVLQTHALVISITQLANPPPVIARVVAADTSLHMMQVDFEDFLALTLTALVRGPLTQELPGCPPGMRVVVLSGAAETWPGVVSIFFTYISDYEKVLRGLALLEAAPNLES